ncbi:MAG: NAD-dependent epimerase/dehydratase family protein [Candidatus Sericytochromatia bacterium]
MKVFVTGGGGFLGQAIVRQLIAQGHQVVSYSRGAYPELAELGVEHRQGDLDAPNRLVSALKDCQAVIHVAAKAGIWGSYESFHSANVRGTENVISACQQAGISKLVYTSSPSVVHNGKDLEGVDESIPYPSHFDAFYPQTKALAEKMVLQANSETLATVSLRPHIIWGPGDPHFVPRLVARAKAGRLRLVGQRDPKVDTVYVENSATAHLLALAKLEPGAPIAGKAYFITQDQPETVSHFINRILAAADLPPVTRRIPVRVAHLAGSALESVYRAFHLPGEPPLTRFMVSQFSTAHWFDISAARRDLGYEPLISTEAGMVELQRWLHPN